MLIHTFGDTKWTSRILKIGCGTTRLRSVFENGVYVARLNISTTSLIYVLHNTFKLHNSWNSFWKKYQFFKCNFSFSSAVFILPTLTSNNNTSCLFTGRVLRRVRRVLLHHCCRQIQLCANTQGWRMASDTAT